MSKLKYQENRNYPATQEYVEGPILLKKPLWKKNQGSNCKQAPGESAEDHSQRIKIPGVITRMFCLKYPPYMVVIEKLIGEAVTVLGDHKDIPR
jgi:hypothetical protein